jgi:hypothetical protein
MPAFIDLTGRQFGRLLVLARAADRYRKTYWHCRCACGLEVVVCGNSLPAGTSTSCGCRRREVSRKRARERFIDLGSQRFGRLLVVREAEPAKSGKVRWLCHCDCGTDRIVLADLLRRGQTTSCGCYHRELVGRQFTTHGRRKFPEYQVYYGILWRCCNPASDAWPYYGGRGIYVCTEWFNSFEQFLLDMGPRPSRGHTIERKNVNGPYSKDNCVWATWDVQARNRRSSRRMTLNGLTLCLTDWAERVGIPASALSGRINRLGWSDELALTTPLRKRRGHYDIDSPAVLQGMLTEPPFLKEP